MGTGASSTLTETDVLVVGAGAKAAALAAKVHAINGLGLAELSLTAFEKTEPAASWLGRNGMTSGEEPLAIPPIKDVGFPYQSRRQLGEAGDAIDAALLPLSWQRYATERGEYAAWVNSGSPPVRHRDYGEYLGWVLQRATDGVAVRRGHVVELSPDEGGERWLVDVEVPGGAPERHASRALVLTGPGVHRAFPHDPAVASRVFHCDSRREEFAQLPEESACDVAIVGGGESALSCMMFLRGFRPRSRFTVYTPMVPMSRGESFLENRVFSNPDEIEWEALDPTTRRDFVKHSDRGVFDPPSLAAIAYDDRCRFVIGRVSEVFAARGGTGVRLRHHSPHGEAGPEHDFVVNCTGFDLLAQLRELFSERTRAEIEARVGQLWDRPAGTEVPIGRNLELQGMSPRLHIPGLAGLSQGPGFANLGALGLMANRVLQPLIAERTPTREIVQVSTNT